MEDVKGKKAALRAEIQDRLANLPKEDFKAKYQRLEERVFNFANFLESKIVLLYIAKNTEIDTEPMLRRCLKTNKILVLPAFDNTKFGFKLLKIEKLEQDLKPGPGGVMEPDSARCKLVPVDCIDIAFIPGVAFDEKGGRLGTGSGFYDRLIPKLPLTTRKIALALEEQIVPQVSMESKNRHVDIIITDNRIIYKI